MPIVEDDERPIARCGARACLTPGELLKLPRRQVLAGVQIKKFDSEDPRDLGPEEFLLRPIDAHYQLSVLKVRMDLIVAHG